MIRLEVSVTGAGELLAADAYGAGALLRVERATDIAGPYTEVATQALVAGAEDYTLFDAGGSTTSWYRSRVSNAGGTLFSGYSDPFQVAPANVVANSEVRALVATSLSDAALEAVIAREEANLAAEIGLLTGPRTEVFTIVRHNGHRRLALSRPADTVAVTVANVATSEVRLADDGRTIVPLAAGLWDPGYWSGVVEVTYSPNDTAKVEQAVIDLVRLTLADTAFDAESIDAYSYTRGGSTDARRTAIYSRFRTRPSAVSVPLTTGQADEHWEGVARP